MSRVQYGPRKTNLIADGMERLDQLVQKCTMVSNRQALYVLKHEIGRLQLVHDPHELLHKRVAWVIEDAMPDQGEALARSPAEYYVDFPVANSSNPSQLGAGYPGDRTRYNRTAREVELVHRRMDGIDLHSGHHIEASLFKTQTQTAGPGE